MQLIWRDSLKWSLRISLLMFCAVGWRAHAAQTETDVNAKDSMGYTRLIRAAEKGDTAGPPRFEDFSVRILYRGLPARIDLASNPAAREYRTRLKHAARKGPNFAGHYTVADWGCGSNCEVFTVIDAASGKVYSGTGAERGALFRLDSALFIADPPNRPDAVAHNDDPTERQPVRYYVWRDDKFTLIYEQACSLTDNHQKCGCEDLHYMLFQPPPK